MAIYTLSATQLLAAENMRSARFLHSHPEPLEIEVNHGSHVEGTVGTLAQLTISFYQNNCKKAGRPRDLPYHTQPKIKKEAKRLFLAPPA